MFTLKLYRRRDHETVIMKVVTVHHVQTMSFQHNDPDGIEHKAIELWAFPDTSSDYDTYLIGEADKHRTPIDMGVSPPTPGWWYDWGLLENAAGKTTEHFRPAGYG
jgi:hypothetical protein